jgi:cell division protein FtsB
MELHEKQLLRKICYSKVTIVILVILVLFLIRGVYGIYEKYQETDEVRDQAKSRLMELQAREKKIANDVANLKTDDGLDRALRQKFGVAKPDESVVVIVDSASSASSTVPVKEGFIDKTFDFFGSIFR